MLVAVFIIRTARSARSAKDLLGEEFAGILTTDRYASYNWLKTTVRQFCRAHLTRDMRKISERSGRPGQIGDEILDYIKRMFRLWHRHKDGEIGRETFQAPVRRNIERMMTATTTCKLQKRNRHDYITAAVEAHLKNEPALSLLSIEDTTDFIKLAA